MATVVDMAVGVVVGGAFTAVVAALTKDLLTLLIAAIVGKTFECRFVNSPISSSIAFLHKATTVFSTDGYRLRYIAGVRGSLQ